MSVDRIEQEFLNLGAQYYLAARSAALAGAVPVTGNLYHHALEMLLKAGLCRTISTGDLKKHFGHKLKRIWRQFKAQFSLQQSEGYDSAIEQIDKWEELRYPDTIVNRGAQLIIDWGNPGSRSSSTTPSMYHLNGTDIDELVIKIFELLSRNPLPFFPLMLAMEHARQIITPHHPALDRIMR